ncbi:MAG: dethiobiotin synthase [Reichenbachiella sp.]
MSLNKRYFVTGIDTDSGKTVVSAALVEHLKADYWKPVQAGFPTDTETIRSLVSNYGIIHPEGKILQAPMSPHAAAKLENIEVTINDLQVPNTENFIIIEGAGGVMVPLNDSQLIIELAAEIDAEIILVSRNYLGSINHTLLSIEYLKNKNYKIAGIIFNDEPNIESESFILKYSGLKCLGHIEKLKTIDRSTIKSIATKIELA